MALGLTNALSTPLRFPLRVVPLVAVLGLGCERATSPSLLTPSWRVLDSTWIAPWDETTDSLAAYRIEVHSASGTDTLQEVLPPWPIASDSTIWGLRRLPGQADRELFHWIGAHRPLATWSLPGDVLSGFNDVMLSPSGEYLAYVGRDNEHIYAAVAARPFRASIWRSQPVSGCDCDVDLSHARWVTADSFEIAVVSTADQRGWAIFQGSVAHRQATRHYEPTEPRWHSSP